MFGVKTPEKLAHLLTSEDSQSVAPYNISHSAVVEAVHSEDPAPILNHSSSISCVDSGSKDSDRVSTVLVLVLVCVCVCVCVCACVHACVCVDICTYVCCIHSSVSHLVCVVVMLTVTSYSVG